MMQEDQDRRVVLVIDTSYGSTVGIVGHEPIVQTDSRTHVEQLQVSTAAAVSQARLRPGDIDCIVTGIGPAPFTGLRAGIVAAKALSFATGATLLGQNVLEPQCLWNRVRRGDATHALTLAVNDARRKQLYFELCVHAPDASGVTPLIGMDIDYPDAIVERVNAAARAYAREVADDVVVDVVGHGAGKYARSFEALERLGDIVDESVLDQGAQGLRLFVSQAMQGTQDGMVGQSKVEPLYLRRPDAEAPGPLKHVLGHDGVSKAAR